MSNDFYKRKNNKKKKYIFFFFRLSFQLNTSYFEIFNICDKNFSFFIHIFEIE